MKSLHPISRFHFLTCFALYYVPQKLAAKCKFWKAPPKIFQQNIFQARFVKFISNHRGMDNGRQIQGRKHSDGFPGTLAAPFHCSSTRLPLNYNRFTMIWKTTTCPNFSTFGWTIITQYSPKTQISLQMIAKACLSRAFFLSFKWNQQLNTIRSNKWKAKRMDCVANHKRCSQWGPRLMLIHTWHCSTETNHRSQHPRPLN